MPKAITMIIALIGAPGLLGLPPSQRASAELAFVRSLGRRCTSDMFVALLGPEALAAVAATYCSGASALGQANVSYGELSSKFVSDGELFFGGIDMFNAGLDAIVGPPHPNLHETMQSEHTAAEDSSAVFQAGNYGIETCAKVEWFFVVDSEAGKKSVGREGGLTPAEMPGGTYPEERWLNVRRRRYESPLSTFEAAMHEVNAELHAQAVPPLRLEELIGARLYTGPVRQRRHARPRPLPRAAAALLSSDPPAPARLPPRPLRVFRCSSSTTV